ncbi:XrtA system polysaccharide deacetylase [Clostridium neonatale]|uniref:XrtA system polysaccharide deacetylase n=1 Tax=Clostridium neonatale TaxID=137838 RepID=UPI002936E2F0|nr:XrtA system polysaccharide deacetylase [Clostridium neonatale]
MNNIFTIDLEEWFHANYEDNLFDNSKQYEVRVIKNTEKLLELLELNNSKATFFTLGYIAEHHPELVKKIHECGHEIASHGMNHQLVYKQDKEQFRQDIRKSKILLEDTIGDEVIGYRAPSWSITDKSKWAWEILNEEGFVYDASIFPIKNFLYGMPDSERFIYHPIYENKELSIVEVPCSTVKIFGKNIPFSGGAYFRLFPLKFIKYFSKSVNSENKPVIFYIHPREIDINQPRLNLGFRDSMIHYYGIKSSYRKLKVLNDENTFISIKQYIYNEKEIVK